MTQQYGGGFTPQQQKAFSSYWLDQQYGGNLNNVPGLTQNENGYWQGEPGRKYDINPETGQKGTFQFLSGSGAPGWIDVTPEKYGEYSNIGGGQVKMIRNRHGLYTPESAYGHDGSFSRQYQFTTNPNTGEEGKWIFLGQMGWVNIEGDPQPEPEEGQIVFGGGGQIAGPYDPDYDGSVKDTSSNTDADSDVSSGDVDEAASAENTTTAAALQQTIPSSQGAFTSSTPMGLRYSAPAAQQFISAAPASKIDYAKALNSALALDVMGNMLTGRKV